MDYDRVARTTKRLIEKNGRAITMLSKASVVSPSNAGKPWNGPGPATAPNGTVQQKYDLTFDTYGVFVVPATSIPTESRGLAYDWVSQDLLAQARHVILVPALGAPDLKLCTDYRDNDGLVQAIIWGQLLMPGDVPLLYCFGTKQ